MALDPSIYQTLRPAQVDTTSPLDSLGKAMALGKLSMEQQHLQRSLADQQAIRDAYTRNTTPDGKLNQQGVLSDLAKTSPAAMMQLQEHFNKTGKDAAELGKSQSDAFQKKASIAANAIDYLSRMPEDQRAQAYPQVVKQLIDQGVASPDQLHPQYDPQLFRGYATRAMQYMGQNSADYLGNQKTKAEIGKTYSDIGQAPAKLNAELYGSRSPNAELTSQYDKQAGPIRSSQIAMNQMLDNYKNPSPQGDASLVLNAFKIKFPTAPDVNSLKELGESQATIDQWKNAFAKSASGGVDQATRDNLLRDAVSTYRGNVDSLRGIQDRYNTRAKFQNVNDPTLTAEPAIDKTYAAAMELQKNIGRYVPPSQRGGVIAGISNFASSLLGGDGKSPDAIATATAADRGSPQAAPTEVRMMGPDGKVRMIPASQVGEAIAAGGKKVK